MMKTLNLNRWGYSCGLQFIMVALGLICFSGCASNSYKKSDAAAHSLQKAAMAVNAESRAIDVTLASMDDLVNKPAGDLRPQFERFSDALNRFMDASARAEKAASNPRRACS